MKFKALLLSAAVLSVLSVRSEACTNVIVTKGASMDASTLVSYAADSHTSYGDLFFRRPGTWKAGDTEKVFDYETYNKEISDKFDKYINA